MNPLDYKGPEFLQFYVLACPVFLVLATCLRWMLRGPGAWFAPRATDDLDPFEVAAISGGERGAIRAAIACLFQRGALIAGVGNNTIARGPEPLRQPHPLEKAVLYAVPESEEVNYLRVESHARSLARQIRARPESQGLMLSPSQELFAWLGPLFLAMLVPLLGLVKVGVGISRGRPVSNLVFLLIASVVVLVLLLRRRWVSTRAGDAYLKRFRRESTALRTTSETSAIGLTPRDVALAFALFGPTALSGGILGRLRTWFLPPVSTSSSGSCSSSGCGGGGCGGGCGGGGCGGCGS